MTTPLVLLGLAILAGAVVWVLSVRQSPQRGSSSWEPAAKTPAPDAWAAEVPAMTTPPPMSAASEMLTPLGADPAAFPGEEDDLDAGAFSAPADSFAYVPLGVSDGLDTKTRLIGVAGLIALIVLTSAAVALGVWFLGHAISQLLSHFATG
jgi:hypothetical protein